MRSPSVRRAHSRRGSYLRGTAVGGLLLLSSCTGIGDGDPPDAGRTTSPDQDFTITVASEGEPASYNNNTAEQNTPTNTFYLNQVLRGFWFFGVDGSVVPDTEFGTFEKTSDDPLTVTYRFDEEAVWSDGEAIDCDDFLLVWAASSGRYSTGETDSAGIDIGMFSTPGTTGFDVMQKPTCADGDREIEVVYDEPYADWRGLFGQGAILPAHVLETRSGVADLVEAVATDDLDQLRLAAQFYNTGWDLERGQLDQDRLPAAGPYRLEAWEPGQAVTLVANDRWWGTPAKARTVVVRIIASTAQDLALENGEVDVIAPQAGPDMLSRLMGLGDAVVVDAGDRFAYEHLDFNFVGPFGNPALREAFARCLPRQLIVDNLVRPINAGAQVLNSRYVFPFQPGYEDVVDAVTDGRYDGVDIEGARALLEAERRVGLPVRIGYPIPSARRADTVSLIRDSCNQAGFDVQDAGDPDFFTGPLSNGNFDVALFGWSGSPLVTGASSTFTTSGGNNNGSYANPQVDRLIEALNSTPDVEEQRALVVEIDTLLWQDLATIPLYAVPGFVAYSPALVGVAFQPSQTGVTWNMHEWRRKS